MKKDEDEWSGVSEWATEGTEGGPEGTGESGVCAGGGVAEFRKITGEKEERLVCGVQAS